jgi:endonuclease/exonuclease/phosphatase (EEP) superfamily protein YafD
MKKIIVFAALLLISSQVHAKRIFLAGQYELVPLEKAHFQLGKSNQNELNPKLIKAFIWNLKKAELPNWDRDFKTVGQHRDLFILSEGYLNSIQKKTFLEFSSIEWNMGASFLYRYDFFTPTGTMIGAKVKPREFKIKHTSDFEPIIRTPKALSVATFPLKGRNDELLVISIHGINLVSLAAFKRHLKIAIEEIETHEGPIIFAGDFNSNSAAKLNYLYKTMSELNFQAVEFKNDQRMKTLGYVIDHVFLRGLYPKNAEVLGHLKSSDHKAMTVDLTVVDN